MPLKAADTIEEATELLRAASSPVVVIAVYNSFDDVARCAEAFVAHTPPTTACLVVDDSGDDRRVVDLFRSVSSSVPHEIVLFRHEANQGYVRSCNDAFAITRGRDVVLLNSDVIVGPEWLERLTAAALGDDSTATATTLTNHGTIVSVPDRNRPTSALPDGITPDEAARRVAAGSLQLRPTLPTAIGHCVYIRRHVLDLIGSFDDTFSPGYGEEVDFSQRAVAHGFRHVCADDVFTYHRGSRSFGATGDAAARQARHEVIVRNRYPWYASWVQRAESDTSSELADALGAARRSLLGLTVGIDAMCLGPQEMGTQRIVVETVRALAQRPEIARMIVFVPERLPTYAEVLRTELPAVEFRRRNPFVWRSDRLVDLIYRPYQVSQLDELAFLHRVADRLVVNQLDTIAFENPAYFASDALWLAYRDVTRLTLGLAHGVAFLSEHGRSAALATGLFGGERPSAVVSCGVDSGGSEPPETCPAPLRESDHGFLLCVGASYLHKNRRFALDLWGELRRRGWDGQIVLAGPTPPFGNSLGREAEFGLRSPELRSDVVTLGAVTEAEKRWLYGRAALVLYPSSVEGFGLVPFEAASHGVPTLATRRGSLAEVLPPGIPALDGFDVSRGADVAWRLLHDDVLAQGLVASLRSRSECFQWDRSAEHLIGLFTETLRQPRGRALTLEGEDGHPLGVPSRSQVVGTVGVGETFERFVQAVIRRPTLKRTLSPNGSRRQQTARTVISIARRQFH